MRHTISISISIRISRCCKPLSLSGSLPFVPGWTRPVNQMVPFFPLIMQLPTFWNVPGYRHTGQLRILTRTYARTSTKSFLAFTDPSDQFSDARLSARDTNHGSRSKMCLYPAIFLDLRHVSYLCDNHKMEGISKLFEAGNQEWVI